MNKHPEDLIGEVAIQLQKLGMVIGRAAISKEEFDNTIERLDARATYIGGYDPPLLPPNDSLGLMTAAGYMVSVVGDRDLARGELRFSARLDEATCGAVDREFDRAAVELEFARLKELHSQLPDRIVRIRQRKLHRARLLEELGPKPPWWRWRARRRWDACMREAFAVTSEEFDDMLREAMPDSLLEQRNAAEHPMVKPPWGGPTP